MCGRYYIEIGEAELKDIISEVEKKTEIYQGELKLKTSCEIFPADMVPVQVGVDEYLPMKWGFAGFNGRPVINAKSETALVKPMFKQAMMERRCLIPASGYYEWQKAGKKKVKRQFCLPGRPMYFAGCYRREKGSPFCNFVILTRQATVDIEHIHDRMPVIIPQKFRADWLHGSPDIMEYAEQGLMYRECF